MSTSLETVGSEATGSNCAGPARSTATSDKQSPPGATAGGRSRRVLPGSCTARGLRHDAGAADTAVRRTGLADGLREQHPAGLRDHRAAVAPDAGRRMLLVHLFTWRVPLSLQLTGPSLSRVGAGQKRSPCI